MKKITTLFLLGLLFSCSSNSKEEKQKSIPIPQLISDGVKLSDSPFLTQNDKNEPVLSWVEGEKEDAYLYFATTSDKGKTFSKPKLVSTTKGLTAHPETMPKLAFKKDGTIIAVFQRRTPTPKNRFAGAIYYSQSFDGGKTWGKANYLHTDTSEGIGRSFFDISVLPDGEIGAVWLDGRKRSRKGSTLCFAKTNGNKGFERDKEIAQKTCQCCRTDIFVDKKNKIHVAFRDIINDSIRDIVHISSLDNGATFSEPKRISQDNWVINGCPHTGPSIANTKDGVSFYWFTSGGKEGVFTTTLSNNTESFSKRKLINPHARHPQVITLKNGVTVLTWDETFKTKDAYINKIGLMVINKDGTETIQYLTTEKEDCDHPVLMESDNNSVLISWTQRNLKEEKTKIYSMNIPL